MSEENKEQGKPMGIFDIASITSHQFVCIKLLQKSAMIFEKYGKSRWATRMLKAVEAHKKMSNDLIDEMKAAEDGWRKGNIA